MSGEYSNAGVVRKLQSIWSSCNDTGLLALCISGSTAREEATEYSDLDVFIITADHLSPDFSVQSLVQKIQFDFQRVSVVIRSVKEFSEVRESDFISWIAALDSRFVAGREYLYQNLWNSIQKECIIHYPEIVQQLFAVTINRHRQYGASTALLEPNIKNGAGSIRDINIICYLEIVSALSRGINYLALPKNIDDVINFSSLRPVRRHALIEAREFMLRVRRTLHANMAHLHDTLDFDCQHLVAEIAEHEDENSSRKKVEVLMRSYYQHSRIIHLSLNLSFYDHGLETGLDKRVTTENMLSLPHGGFKSDEEVLKLFLQSIRERKTIGGDVIREILDHNNFDYSSKECGFLFNKLLLESERVGSTLRTMHECGVLKRILPEFAATEFFFQHNIYHFYTVDEHTLQAIEAAEKLKHDSSHFGEIFRNIGDVSVLYYAILLHDIAKPLDIASHEIIASKMVQSILVRYGRENDAETVSLLVLHHLEMEKTAFRRDLTDPVALRSFVRKMVSRKNIEILYLLTYADMSALNPRVFTDWKKHLLLELFLSTYKFNESSWSIEENNQKRISRALEEISTADFHRAMEDVREGEPVRLFVFQRKGFTEVLIFCLDRKLLLSRLAIAFLAADAAVVDASIETRSDVAIDVFKVTDLIRNGALQEPQIQRLKLFVRAVCTGEVEAEQVFLKFRRKWIRKIRKTVKASVRTDILFIDPLPEAKDARTIIEVYAPDAYGLLYVLSREISSFGLDISFAKIGTRVDGVVDSFYVREAMGLPFTDALRRDLLRAALLRQISDLSHVE